MRFEQHLYENITFQNKRIINGGVLKMLMKDCKPYLDDAYKVHTNLLFRGFEGAKGDAFIAKPRKDRRPTDSDQLWHDALDDAFKIKFGVKARSEGLFCKLQTPTGYGVDYMPIPAGRYTLIYSPRISDAYFWDQEAADRTAERIAAAHELSKSYTKGSLVNAVKDLRGTKKRNEIALICNKYYAIHVNYYNQLMEWNKGWHEA